MFDELKEVKHFNPKSAHCFLIFLRKRRQFHCTSLLPSSKLLHLDYKNLTCFIQNLVQNLKNLLSNIKTKRSGQKTAKTKTFQKTTYMWHLGSKG